MSDSAAVQHLAIMAASPVPQFLPETWDSDFASSHVEEFSFDSDFSAQSTAVAFDSDFSTSTYQMNLTDVAGTYRIDTGLSQPGIHQRGADLDVLWGGFDSDFSLPPARDPIGYEGVAFDSNFQTGRHVAETYPSPVAFDSDFAANGIAFDSDMQAGTYAMVVTSSIDGVFTRDTSESFLTGRLLIVPTPFWREQIVLTRFKDDRLGKFILGRTVLGGAPI